MTCQMYAHLAGRPLDEGEVLILDLLSRGRTNAQIGRLVDLSEDNVKGRLRKMFCKLEVTDRAHAVRAGFQHGYLRLDAPAERVAS